MYVGIRRMPPKNWGHFLGQSPPKEHIPPPIWASLQAAGDRHHVKIKKTTQRLDTETGTKYSLIVAN